MIARLQEIEFPNDAIPDIEVYRDDFLYVHLTELFVTQSRVTFVTTASELRVMKKGAIEGVRYPNLLHIVGVLNSDIRFRSYLSAVIGLLYFWTVS